MGQGVKPDETEQHAGELVEAKGEILKLHAQLRRTEEDRDILKRPPRTLRGSPSKVRLYPGPPARIQRRGHVPSIRGSAQRVLCVAAHAIIRSRHRGSTFAWADPRLLGCQPPRVWVAADLP